MNIPLTVNQKIEKNRNKKGIVALESTVITHGLPYPTNEETALGMEQVVLDNGCIPATIGLIDGEIIVGLDKEQIHYLSKVEKSRKISQRDYGIALAEKLSGGTTVAGTIIASGLADIKVFATGGIGGVHRGSTFDISADLTALSQNQIIVVCAGAKSILDLPATVEKLETLGIPVLGFETDEFPAFYSKSSGLNVDKRVDSAKEVVEIAKAHWNIGIKSAILVVVPPPDEYALPYDEIEKEIQQAVKEAEEQNITGSKVTPFLLAKMTDLTKGTSMRTNLALLNNNARVASLIAAEFIKE